MRVLITGAGGQIGRELAGALVEAGNQVHGMDLRPRPITTDPAALEPVRWHRGDVRDREQVERRLRGAAPEVVYHLAAVLSARGEADAHLTYEVNQHGTYNVLEAARLCGVRQVVLTSTIAVYGAGVADCVPEEVPLHPATMYGVTKAAGEMLGEYYQRRWGVDFRAVRFPGIIGPGAPGGGSSDYAIHMYTQGIRQGAYEAFCREDTRIPLMYMPDAVRALIELAGTDRAKLRRSVYNITAFSPTAGEIAQSVMQAAPGVKITFRPDPLRQAILDSWPRALDDRAARADWNWQPRFDLERMTAEMVRLTRGDGGV